MSARTRRWVSAALAALAGATASAQGRPGEDELFGGAPPAATPSTARSTPTATATPTPTAPRPAESDLFGEPPAPAPGTQPPGAQPPGTQERLSRRLGETENPLAIGGQLYLRSFLLARQGEPPSGWSLTAPALVDGYLDARPIDRVRGFLLARMQYDPTLDPNAPAPVLAGLPGVPGAAAPSNPRVLLDQLWLRFDAEKVAFFTVGKQHVKWGTGRFWNPTDYLHAVRRDPLGVFDPRTGTTMVRVHLPWERRGWNLYGMAILEPLVTGAATGALAPDTAGPSPTPAQTVGGVGGAARAEVVLGPSELAAGAVVQRGHRPRFALDASVGVLDVDLYGEAALKTGSEITLWRQRAGADASTPLAARYETYEPSGLTPAVTLGGRWVRKYSDEDSLEVGLEYFYNRVGYDDPAIYPVLLFTNSFTPFYLGRHYGGAYLYLPKPGAWNQTTFILSTLGNLSDRSFVTRLDWSVLLLTYLRLEAYGQLHYGARDGELRLGLDVPPQVLGPGQATPAVRLGPSIFDLGLALRVSL